MSIDQGGQAFPSNDRTYHGTTLGDHVITIPAEPGMTLRQYYAGIALPSVIAKAIGSGLTVDPALAEIYSRDAFRWADAMIKASKE